MNPIERTARPLTPHAAPARDDRAVLRGLARQLESVFVAQLFKAMRSSVPKSGFTGGSSGEETFTAMLDEKIADRATGALDDRIGEALVRQLARRASPPDDRGAPVAAAPRPLERARAAYPVPLVAPAPPPIAVTREERP